MLQYDLCFILTAEVVQIVIKERYVLMIESYYLNDKIFKSEESMDWIGYQLIKKNDKTRINKKSKQYIIVKRVIEP